MGPHRRSVQTLQDSVLGELTLVQGKTLRVPVQLNYDSSDPYAVTIGFHVEDRPVVSWTFARDLLSEGLTEPIGDGDVHVWPGRDHGGLTSIIELSSGQGNALIEFHTAAATAFMARTHAIVAPGEESAHLDVEATITAILATEGA